MTPQQIDLVQDSFSKVEPIAEVAAGLFYDRLFVIAPELKPLFKGDMKRQGAMLMSAIKLAVDSLRAPDTLMPILKKLGERHVSYGVQSAHYRPVGEALIWTLQQGLGEGFTEDTQAAWLAAYAVLADAMQAA